MAEEETPDTEGPDSREREQAVSTGDSSAASVRPAWGRFVVVALILGIYALSVVARLPYLDNPLGLHHDEGTARALIHSAVWWEDGPSAGGYIMRRTLMSPGDKHLGSGPGDGNVYYYSFPPGHPLLAFAVHRAVGYEPTIDSVRWLNLALGFLSAVGIYLIVRELLRKLPVLWSRFAAMVAFTLYVFTPVGLWYHSNAYMSSSVVQPFFIAALLAAAYAYRPRESRPWLWPVLYGVAVALACYTEWLGPALAFVTVIVWLFRRDDAVLRRLAVAGAAAAAITLGIVAVQYTISLGGLGEFARHGADRYTIRSGFDAGGGGGWTIWRYASWERLAYQYARSVGYLAVLAVVLWIWDRVAGRATPGRFRAGDAPIPVVLVLSLVPVVLHNLVLFDHTVVHDFDMLKWSVFLCVAIGVLVGRLLARYATKTPRVSLAWPAGVALVLATVVLALSWNWFDYQNKDERPEPERLGTRIAATVEPDEVVFIASSTYLPFNMVTWYSGRNFSSWPGDPEATREILAAGGDRTGVVFLLDKYLGVVQTGYVGTDGVVYTTREGAKATLGNSSQTD
jgi:hypothetical protein